MTDDHPESRARMVDVGGKPATEREAVATGVVHVQQATASAIAEGSVDKGDVREVARIAGIMGAKRTAELIPLCHPIALDAVSLDVEAIEAGIAITATVGTTARTGVEMEALTAVAVAALTVYDMVKGIDRGAWIGEIRLVRKSGGASGEWVAG